MSSALETLLALHGDDILHAAPAGETVGKDSKPDKKGGGKFDEGKVKRDGRGKFSKKELTKAIDDAWLHEANLEALGELLVEKNGDEMMAVLKKAAKEYGIKPKAFSDPKNVDALDDVTGRFINVLNEQAKTDGVSPSGTQRVEFSVDKNRDLVPKAVPHHGPNPYPATTRALSKAYTKLHRQPSGGGMRFNPDAKLDTSRVSDRTDAGDDSPDELFSWLKRVVQHSEEDSVTQHIDVEAITHSSNGLATKEDLENFLAHVGVKGMRWGVRRTDAQLSTGSSSSKPGGKTGDSDGGGSSDVHVSADAERFLKTHQKQGIEMSDREIKEALNRARMVKEYDEVFGQSSTTTLKKKVETLRLEKEYRELSSSLRGPGASEKLRAFVKGSASAYETYAKLNKSSDGALAKNLNGFMGKNTGGKHRRGA